MNPVDLKDLLSWEECYSEIDVLSVSWLALPQFVFNHSLVLARLCNQYRVKKLIFTPLEKEIDDQNFQLLDRRIPVTQTEEDQLFPNLHYLREIVVDRVSYAVIKTFVTLSRAVRVHHILDRPFATAPYRAALFYVGYSGLKENYSLRIMDFVCYYNASELREVAPDPQTYVSNVQEVKVYLKRNQLAWERCRSAVTTILGLRKRREFRFLRDPFALLARIISASSGTKVWDLPEPPVD